MDDFFTAIFLFGGAAVAIWFVIIRPIIYYSEYKAEKRFERQWLLAEERRKREEEERIKALIRQKKEDEHRQLLKAQGRKDWDTCRVFIGGEELKEYDRKKAEGRYR